MDTAMLATVDQVAGYRKASIRRMGITRQSLPSFIVEFGRMPQMNHGFAFPVYRWFMRERGSDMEVAIIDRGAMRVRIEMRLPNMGRRFPLRAMSLAHGRHGPYRSLSIHWSLLVDTLRSPLLFAVAMARPMASPYTRW